MSQDLERAMPTPGSERDWTEDFAHENGNYMHRCRKCSEQFFGHKRRVVCKACTSPIPQPALAPSHTDLMLSPEEIDEFLKMNPPPEVSDENMPLPSDGLIRTPEAWAEMLEILKGECPPSDLIASAMNRAWNDGYKAALAAQVPEQKMLAPLTVGDLIAQLSDFSSDLPVDIEGYVPGTADQTVGLKPANVEGWQKEDGARGVTIHARVVSSRLMPEPDQTDEVKRLRTQLTRAFTALFNLPPMTTVFSKTCHL